ncbi:MAG: class II fructose-bisphosphate aldolase [Anaerolineae bacterium]|nr:class II fructose-bisphosphate aldolase [Candidatus Roseilinea sp.]MDW8448506.1 class II fructose-bisphosphate aldolase [Anaerolineae bacterium]
MPLVSFTDLMTAAAQDGYAVGYFESWNLESLMAVADAAEAMRSPVLLGFSGIYLPNPDRVVREPLSVYAAMGMEICRSLRAPACLVFNESPYIEAVREAIRLGFGLVMFSEEETSYDAQVAQVRSVVAEAGRSGVAVEGEPASLPGVGGELADVPDDLRLTDPNQACAFVEATGVQALAVNVGQAHLHGKREVRLDLAHLAKLRDAVAVPLVLHGATSVNRDDLRAAIALGIRKVNVGSLLKRTYFEAMRAACLRAGADYNPYEVLGSGKESDVLAQGRLAMRRAVEDLMRLFGSVNKA